MLVLGVGVLIAYARQRQALQLLERWWLLAASYLLLLLGWAATTLEALLPLPNWLEHGAYAIGAVLAAIWCAQAPSQLRGEP